jgi:hypothetical protein
MVRQIAVGDESPIKDAVVEFVHVFFVRFFRACARFHFASRFSTSSFDTLNIRRTALSNFSASVLPGTFGAGSGFISLPS